MSEVTTILDRVQQGDAQAADELRKLASAKMANEAAGHTPQPTALVHEAWMRLGGFGAAAEAMRMLIERARRRIAAKRGAGAAKVDLDEIEISSPVADDDQLLAVNEALEKFAALNPRKAALVKLRYFVGMSFDEAATRWASPCPQPDSGGPTPAPGSRSNARWEVAMKRRRSALLALRQVRIPSGVGESGSGGRIGNADEVLAAGTLNLPARELSLALERLFAVRTIEFEFSCAQKLQPYSRTASG